MSIANIWLIGAAIYFVVVSGVSLCYTVGRAKFHENWNDCPRKHRWVIVTTMFFAIVLASLFWFGVVPCMIYTAVRRFRRGEPIIG